MVAAIIFPSYLVGLKTSSRMTIHRIRLLGDPVLRSRCEPVTSAKSPAVRLVADDLQETLRNLKVRHGFGRGLSAPQVGAPLRLVYIEIEEPWLLINPEIVDVGTEDFFVWDDCFSFPDLLVRVQRAYHIKVRYLDSAGKEQIVEASDSLSELLQHEIDHLDGVLAVDRATGLDPFCLREEWNLRYADKGRTSRPSLRVPPAVEQLV
jgi:peptide deformylase